MARRYRSDPAVMRAGVRSVPRSIPDQKVPDRRSTPPSSSGYPPSIWHSADREAHPGGTDVTPQQRQDMVFHVEQVGVPGRVADTNIAPRGPDVWWAAPLPASSGDRPTPRLPPNQDCSAAGHVTASLADQGQATGNPRPVREPFHVRHPAPMPLTPVQRGPRHRAEPATHRTAWVTVAAVAVAFLAGTTMANLDRSSEQASPRDGSSVGGSTPLDRPRTGFSFDPLDATVSDSSPNAQPAFTVANALVAMNSEAAATVQGDTVQGLAGDAAASRIWLAGQASATPVPLGAAEPKTAATVVRAGASAKPRE